MLFKQESLIVVSKRQGAAFIPEGYTQILIDRNTPLGNRCYDDSRDLSIQKHRKWLKKQVREKTKIYRILKRIAKRLIGGEKIALVCWCSPKPCHGDNLKNEILKIRRRILE